MIALPKLVYRFGFVWQRRSDVDVETACRVILENLYKLRDELANTYLLQDVLLFYKKCLEDGRDEVFWCVYPIGELYLKLTGRALEYDYGFASIYKVYSTEEVSAYIAHVTLGTYEQLRIPIFIRNIDNEYEELEREIRKILQVDKRIRIYTKTELEKCLTKIIHTLSDTYPNIH